MQSVRVHPSLRACVSFSFTVMGGVLCLLLITDLMKGRLSWDKVHLAVIITCAIGGGLGLFLYAIGWAFATTIREGGLRGPTMWGSGTMIGWNEIASVRRVTVKGLPYLIVRSHSSNKEVWLCILGFDDSIVLDGYRRLLREMNRRLRLATIYEHCRQRRV